MQAAAQAVGLASGPVTGGVLVAAAGWRWVFLLNVPVGLVAVAAGRYLLPRTRRLADREGADPVGMILLAASTITGMLAISSLSGLGMPGWAAAACAAVAVLAAAALPWQERRSPAPLLGFRALAVGGTGPALGGALPAPDAVSVVLLGLLGAGLGVYTPANNAEIMAAVPATDAAAAGGMVNMTRGIGTALGVAVVTLRLHAGTALRHPGAGQELSMTALAVVALAATWAGLRAGRRTPGARPGEAAHR